MSDPGLIVSILFVLFLLLEALAAAAREGFKQVHIARLAAQRDEHEKGVKSALDMLHSQPRLDQSLQTAQFLLYLILSGLFLALVISRLPEGMDWLLWVGLVLFGILLLIFEQLIQVLVNRAPEKWVIWLAPFTRFLTWIFSPLTALSMLLTHRSEETREGIGIVTEDELKIMVDAGQEGGVLEQDEREMIYSIFRLGDTLAREIMVPRIYITALDVSMPVPQAAEALLASGHSRVPVFDETVDHVVGLLYAKDLLRLAVQGKQPSTLRDVTREAYFVPEAKKVDELLDEMQARRIHMAIVIDEYGGVAGLVTLEDIVEEIIGEIRDEFDQAEELPYQMVGEGEFIFLGRVDVVDFNEIMGTQLTKEEADTVGGFIYSRIGRVPVGGESVQVDGVLLTVEQVSGRRIRKIRAQKVLPLSQVEGDEDGNA